MSPAISSTAERSRATLPMTPATGPAASTTTSSVQQELRGARSRSSHRHVGMGGSGGSGMVCRVIGQLRGVHEAAPATVSCLASRVACS
eukprot:6701855-Prymnesium_polylepis.2